MEGQWSQDTRLGIILSGQRAPKAPIRLQSDMCLCCSHVAKTGFLTTWLNEYIPFKWSEKWLTQVLPSSLKPSFY